MASVMDDTLMGTGTIWEVDAGTRLRSWSIMKLHYWAESVEAAGGILSSFRCRGHSLSQWPL